MTIVQCHPTESMMFAAGCHTGEVLIYRLDREGEEEIASSGSVDSRAENHNPVTSLLWLNKTSLVSVHSTGFIRLYNLDLRKYQLVLQKVNYSK